MSVLLFRLNDVPEDEAAEIRALLDEHDFDYYETDSGRWGISVAAIWLRDASRLAQARHLIDEYQQARQARMQHEYEALRSAGRHETFSARLRREPIRLLVYLGAIAAILYLTLMPFLGHW